MENFFASILSLLLLAQFVIPDPTGYEILTVNPDNDTLIFAHVVSEQSICVCNCVVVQRASLFYF